MNFSSKKINYVLIIAFAISLLFSTKAKSDNDIVRAMRDEVNRSMSELQLKTLEKPCYLEYSITMKDIYNINAVLGSITESNRKRLATLNVTIHVGSYNFNNTNFFDFGFNFFGSGDDEEAFVNRIIPLDIDYNGLRRELWLATDAAYKQASEIYAKKNAFVKSRMRKDTTPDFTYLPPEKNYDTSSVIQFNKAKYESLCKSVSSVFLNYPKIYISSVGAEYIPMTEYFVNSEGREFIKNSFYTGFEIIAVNQADDGMPLTNMYSTYGLNPEDLPSKDSLTKAAKELAENLMKLSNAPVFESPYSGPILFEGQASAELFTQIFAPNLVTQRQSLTEDGLQESERYMAFQSKIGGRVLPEFLSVNANPGIKKYDKTDVIGYFKIDDEGVLAQNVNIIKDGYLKNLLSTRVPTKRMRLTNGYKRGGAAMFSELEMTSDKKHQKSRADLVKQMLKLCKDRELPFGIIVRKVMNQNMMYTTLQRVTANQYPIPMGMSKIPLIEVYKVYPDGKEELVRGCEGLGYTVQSFKDILNVGNVQYPLNMLAPSVASPFTMGGEQYYGSTVIVPNMLFEDGEIKPIEGDYPKPPIIPNPISRIK